MANEEHLAILKQGVEVWNEWRKENPDPIPDLSGADFVRADLSGANLSEADLSLANFFNADLSGAFFLGANLSGANLTEADLSLANFFNADLSGAFFLGANLSGASLIRANVSGADLTGLRYKRKAMQGCYIAIRGVESCVGNPIFKRDAQDQEYIDALGGRCGKSWRKRFLFRLWAWTDYGRGMPRVAGVALFLVLIFGTVYKFFPNLIDYGRHTVTWFTPYYFSFVTYTTLGFGDVTAKGVIGEILVTFEVVLGYLTLGLLLAILANTVARRS